MKDDWVKVFVALFLIGIIGFSIWVVAEAGASSEATLDRMCEEVMRKNQWAFIAPPMEKNDVWITRKAAEKSLCIARKQDHQPTQ